MSPFCQKWHIVVVLCYLSLTGLVTCRRTRRIRLYLTLHDHQQLPRDATPRQPWQINQDICPPSLCAWHEETKKHRPRITGTHDSSPFYNGDIVLDTDIRSRLFPTQKGQISQSRLRRRRAAVRRKRRLWRNGKIPYIIAKNIPKKTKKAILEAMKHIQDHTCIKFVEKTTKDKDYLYYIYEPGCWSFIGRVGGEQKVSMGDGCHFFGTVLHETVHALGFWHEQSRPDRDKYVRVLKENISQRNLADFDKIKTSVTSSWGFPYDYRSVTHYSDTAFTNNGKNTIELIGPGKKLGLRIGQRKGLSNLDIAQLNHMYKCNRKQDSKETVCDKGWQKFRRSCYKFNVSPKSQFAAASKHCSEIGANLVSIESKKEDNFLKKHLLKHHSHVNVWRTAGRKEKNKFVWYNVETEKAKPMKYTRWAEGHPGRFTSMALMRETKEKTFKWAGFWSGSQYQLPDHAFSFICEKTASRKCIQSKYKDGRTFRGKLSHTVRGVTCQKWSSQWPHNHKVRISRKTRLQDGLGDHNKCRNPTAQRRKRPWCFTTKPGKKWDYCDVTVCK